MKVRVLKAVGVLVLIGIATFAGSYWLTINSEAFGFASEQVRRSKVVTDIVGPVTEVKLPVSAPFEEKMRGDSRTASLELLVSGTKGRATVLAQVAKERGVWRLTELQVNGQRMPID